MRVRFLLVVLTMVAAACGDTAGTTTTVADPGTTAGGDTTTTTTADTTTTEAASVGASEETIFFIRSNADQTSFNVFSIQSDGSGATQLTDSGTIFIPSISPDRSRVSYFDTTSGEEFVFVMNHDGTGHEQVTFVSSANADWHPDGTGLVMNGDHGGEPVDTPDVYHLDLASGEFEQLVDSDDTADFDAHYTPDGGSVIFVSNRNGDFDVFILDLASGETEMLIGGAGNQEVPRISPDGTKVLFTESHDGLGGTDTWVYDMATGERAQLTFEPGLDDMADWSPDGTRIVFLSDRGGNFDLWIMDADGSNPVQLTDTPEIEVFPSWS